MSFFDRAKKGWNVFRNNDKNPESPVYSPGGSITSRRPDRTYYRSISGKDITASIYNRIAVDVSNVDIRHIKLDEKGRYIENINSPLNNCLTLEANIDQTASDFKRDIAHSILEEGNIAVVPIDTDSDPDSPGSTIINTMRKGTVVGWYPEDVVVKLFREEYGRFEDIKLPKTFAAVIENPFYSIMNEPNSTLQRLTRKISLLDAVDEQIGSGKLDLIIQLPYIVKTDTKRAQAEKRREELEAQLNSSQMGVAYTDGTEKVIQLNRPVENNLLKNVESLTNMLYAQLGITEEVLNGTASEEVMLNYRTRTIRPLLKAITERFRSRFLTKTARSQGQSIAYFFDPFDLIPLSQMGDIVDKFTRAELMSTNEFRPYIGLPIVDTPSADSLANPNMPATDPIEVQSE